jgi:mono/diheme cytochrome c family protein
MNPEMKQPAATALASAEMETRDAVVPIWLILLTALLFFWGAVYFDDHSGWFNTKVYSPYQSFNQVQDFQPRPFGPDKELGRRKFEDVCAVCHGSDGRGKPGQAPPLAGSEWVNARGINRLVRIPVLGLNGTIEVIGQQYNFPSGGMTPAAPQSARTSNFTDEQLANVLTYIRSAWGNTGSEVTEEEVKAIRDNIGNRATPMTMDEVKSLPEEFKK